MPIRLTQAAVKGYREAKLKEQGGRCALTGYTISAAEAVLDHDHATGHVRGVLHRGVNALLGKCENNYRRYGVSLPMLRAMAPAMAAYIEKDYSANVFYPTHSSVAYLHEASFFLARASRARLLRSSRFSSSVR